MMLSKVLPNIWTGKFRFLFDYLIYAYDAVHITLNGFVLFRMCDFHTVEERKRNVLRVWVMKGVCSRHLLLNPNKNRTTSQWHNNISLEYTKSYLSRTVYIFCFRFQLMPKFANIIKTGFNITFREGNKFILTHTSQTFYMFLSHLFFYVSTHEQTRTNSFHLSYDEVNRT